MKLKQYLDSWLKLQRNKNYVILMIGVLLWELASLLLIYSVYHTITDLILSFIVFVLLGYELKILKEAHEI